MIHLQMIDKNTCVLIAQLSWIVKGKLYVDEALSTVVTKNWAWVMIAPVYQFGD